MAALMLSWMAGCSRQDRAEAQVRANPAEPAMRVTVVSVVERPMRDVLTLTGTLIGDERSDVAAGASGVVRSTHIERGAMVNKGDVLARIEAEAAAAGAREAEAQAQAAEVQATLAEQECRRFEQLFRTRAISQAEYDQQQARCRAQRLTAQAAVERQRTAEKALRDTVVRAPISGMIAQRFVSAGEYVRPDSKVVSVVSIRPLRLELTVPEALVTRMREGLPVDFHVTAFPDRIFSGKIRFIGPSVEMTSRALVVEAIVPNEGGELRPGMFATADVVLGMTPMPVVPKAAVHTDEATSRVFVVSEGHVEERIVELDGAEGDVAAIARGLHAGERVVSPIPPGLRDGAPIEVE